MQSQKLLEGKAVVRGISLPQTLSDALIERARLEDRPVSTVVKRALVVYLSEQKSGGQQGPPPEGQ